MSTPDIQHYLDRLEAVDQVPRLPAHSYYEGNRQVRNFARQQRRQPSTATLTVHAKRHHQDEVVREARNLGLHVQVSHQLVTVSS